MATKQQGNTKTGHRSSGATGGVSRKGAGVRSGKNLQAESRSMSSRSASSSSGSGKLGRQTRSSARTDKPSQSMTKSKRASAKAGSHASEAASGMRALGSKLKNAAKTLVSKVRRSKPQESADHKTPVATTTARQARPAPRRTTRVAPTVHRDDAFTPSQRSTRAPFDRHRAEKPRDRESDLLIGMADERFNEEDRFTNKSGDPRIGTHGRTYERDEKRQ